MTGNIGFIKLEMLPDQLDHSSLLHTTQAWFIAGIFVMLALPVSIYEVAMHLEYFSTAQAADQGHPHPVDGPCLCPGLHGLP